MNVFVVWFDEAITRAVEFLTWMPHMVLSNEYVEENGEQNIEWAENFEFINPNKFESGANFAWRLVMETAHFFALHWAYFIYINQDVYYIILPLESMVIAHTL